MILFGKPDVSISRFPRFIRLFLQKTQTKIRINSISKLNRPFNIYHLFYFLLFFWRRNYEFGGFRNYEFGVLNYLKSITKSKYVTTEKNNQIISDSPIFIKELLDKKSEPNPGSQPNYLTLFPSNFGKNLSEKKLPQLFNLINSAQEAGVSLHSFDSDVVSNAGKFLDSIAIEKEWQEIENIIVENSISALVILGHKRSFCLANSLALDAIRRRHKIKVLLYVTDNWNAEYVSMIENWEPFIDLIISYDYKIYEMLATEIHEKVLVWPVFPLATTKANLSNNFCQPLYYFGGTCYLNRWVWSLIISTWLRFTKANSGVIFDYNLQPIDGSQGSGKTIGEYRDNYSGNNKIALHFLERHPNIYILTSSVWDSFAGGSLVLAQIGKEYDPISSFFHKGQHYLAFTDLEDLVEILGKIDRNPEWAYRIASSGHDYFRDNYSPRNLWQMLNARLTQ